MAELLNAANRARTALSGAITATATSFSVEDASSFPKPPFAITVEDEIMEVGTVSGNTFSNVTRGLEGTVAVAHEQGAPVENRFTAGTYNRMVDSFNEQKVKVIKVEQELNNFKTTLQQININQEAKQKVSGYDIITIPKNAAKGQVSACVIKGQTWTNKAGVGDTSPQTVENLDAAKTYLLINSAGANVEIDTVDTPTPVKLTGETSFDFVWASGKIALYELSAEETALDASVLGQKYHYVSGTKSTVSAMRLKSVSADETETSTAHVVAKDEEGNIAELRSLPNGVKDEIRVSGGKAELAKRVGKTLLNGNEPWGNITTNEDNYRSSLANFVNNNNVKLTSLNFSEGAVAKNELGEFKQTPVGIDNAAYQFQFNSNDYRLYLTLPKSVVDTMVGATILDKFKAYLNQYPVTLTYQLAEPIETHVQTSGSLVSYPSGTIYVDPIVADAGIYTDKMEVLYSDLPIKALEKISKVDFDTGLETELDITAAVIAEDKLSFTHPDLTSGDIVFFVYEHGSEGTIPETEIEYYDSRYVIKDKTTGKFYKWNIEVDNGVPNIVLTEV